MERFGMKGVKSVVTPLNSHFRLFSKQFPTTTEDKAYMKYAPYVGAVGSLIYLMVCTYQYISQVVSFVSRFIENLGKEHWEAVKWFIGT